MAVKTKKAAKPAKKAAVKKAAPARPFRALVRAAVAFNAAKAKR